MYCPQCATRARGGAVYRFLTGQDAPVSVLATALYTELPPDLDEEMEEKPGQGRKLLIFRRQPSGCGLLCSLLGTYIQQHPCAAV